MSVSERITHYSQLIRLEKPVGTVLLLWPTLWALWLAASGVPPISTLLIFVVGVFLMRSAGCIANDIADRHLDKYVARTVGRPLASGKVSLVEALLLFIFLLLLALGLVLQTNYLTVALSVLGAIFAVGYPWLKRVTHLPQLGLGVAFAWCVPMAFAAVVNQVPWQAWYVFAVVVIWPVIYDTMYAMVDRPDDIKIGIKSTAILFGQQEIFMIALLQGLMLVMLLGLGLIFHLTKPYYLSVLLVLNLFCYQHFLIRYRDPFACFKAFLNHQWVGFIVFLGIVLGGPA